jgi:large subunit ribosomal protein L25
MINPQRELNVATRTTRGKGPARQMRMKGLIPGVLYGGGGEHVKLSVDPHQFRKAIDPERKLNTYWKLTVDDGEIVNAIIADHQINAVQNKLIHIDFMRVDPTSEVVTKIPIKYTGRAVGVLAGGKLYTYRRFIKVAATPGNLPVFLDVDVSALNIDETLLLSEITLEDVRFLEDPRLALASVAQAKAKSDEDEGNEGNKDTDKDKEEDKEEGAKS